VTRHGLGLVPVSHICKVTTWSSTTTSFIRKSAPVDHKEHTVQRRSERQGEKARREGTHAPEGESWQVKYQSWLCMSRRTACSHIDA